jgi:hypothetical protein
MKTSFDVILPQSLYVYLFFLLGTKADYKIASIIKPGDKEADRHFHFPQTFGKEVVDIKSNEDDSVIKMISEDIIQL